MIRILNAEPRNYSSRAREILTSIGEVVERQLSQGELIRFVRDFDVLIIRLGLRVDRDVLSAARGLRAVVTATTGLDHIDLACAERQGVTVLSLKGEAELLRSIVATAEHTWALVLSLTRRIPWAYSAVVRGEWNRDAFRGCDLRGKQLGIVGLGRVGERVAQYGLTFGMRVMAYDPYRPDWVPEVERFGKLAELLKASQVLSLHVAATEETRNMLGAEELNLLPRGAILINTCRGSVIDENALIQSLSSGHLGGAALDVLQVEVNGPSIASSRLVTYARARDNLIITPHLGGATVESMEQTEIFMAEKLRSFAVKQGWLH